MDFKKLFFLFDSLISRWECLETFTDQGKGGRKENEVDFEEITKGEKVQRRW